MLAASLPSGAPAGLTRSQVLRASRPVFTTPGTRAVMRVLLEAVGLGALLGPEAEAAAWDAVVAAPR